VKRYYIAGAGLFLLRPMLFPGRIISVAKGELGGGYRETYGPAVNWCAVFAGWVIEKAARSLALGFPSWRYENGKPVAGAKRLVERAAEAGQWIARNGVLLATPQPGDLVSFDRGAGGSWQGHVAIVTSYRDGFIETISGNSGSRVKAAPKGKLSTMRLEAIARPHVSDPFLKLGITAGISWGAYHYLLR
jgi:hypothetical protein